MLALLKLDKEGGKERDCIAIAHHLSGRGHDVTLLTTSKHELALYPFRVVTLRAVGLSNHARAQTFATAVGTYRKRENEHSVLLAFEKMPGADFFYAADNPTRGYVPWPPRRRIKLELETGVFGTRSRTHTFFLTARQREKYSAIYGPSTGTILPTIVHDDRYDTLLEDFNPLIRSQFGLPSDSFLAISVATNPKLKGVDRTLNALPFFPKVNLLLVGSNEGWIRRHVKKLNLEERVHIMPYSTGIMEFISAADFLVHPARAEAAGQVIVEALLAGVPAIVSAVCGYADTVHQAGAGIVLPEQFGQEELVNGMAKMIEALPIMRKTAAEESQRLRRERGEWLNVIAREIERAEGRAPTP